MTDISIQHLKRAVEERPKGGMQTGLPNITLREADAVRLIAYVESLENELTKAIDIIEESGIDYEEISSLY